MALSLQVRVLQLAPDATDVAMSIYSGIFNIGISGGALVGNQTIHYLGLPFIGFVGAAFASAATLLLFWLSHRYGTPPDLKNN